MVRYLDKILDTHLKTMIKIRKTKITFIIKK